MVRVGRRGSLNACITIHGVQGHVAYPELVNNPIHDDDALDSRPCCGRLGLRS